MDELISRQAAIDAMRRLEQEDIEAYGAEIPEGFDAEPAVEALKALPSAQPEQKTGRWIWDSLVCTSGGNYGVLRCSECEAYYERVGFWPRRYCPKCGAKMEEGDG